MKIVNWLACLLFLGAISLQEAQAQPWTYVNTGTSHTVIIPTGITPTADGVPLTNGDYIGVFYRQGGTPVCAGYEMWNGSSNITVSAFGDDATTPAKDGFASGEVFQWKVWRHGDGLEGSAAAQYAPIGGIITNADTYSANGISQLTGLTATIAPLTASISVSTSSLPDFGSVQVGNSSTSQSYTVSGSNLTASITVTAPAGFQVSLNNSSFSGSVTLIQSGGTVPATLVYVRFSPSSAGTQTGNITHTSTGATTKNVGVSGTGVLPTFTISLSSSPPAGGTTSGGGTYNQGASATVTATPAAGYTFVNWTEGGSPVSSIASYTFTVSGNRTLVANFTLITFTISTSSNPPAGGSTSGGGTYNQGGSATVTATPATGYTFVNWTEGGSPVSTSASYTFTVSGNRTLVANFAAITYNIGTSSSPPAGGSTSGGGLYNAGQSATVTATPAAGYAFVNWTEGGSQVSSSASYTFTVSGNRTLVANFALITYTIGTSSNPPAGGSTSGGGTYNQGASATVTATPATGYTFVNWTEGGSQVSTSASYTFTVSGNRMLVANYAAITYTINTSSSPSAGGSTSGGGTYNKGASATVTAAPATGYTFVNWSEGGSQVSTSASYTFTVSGNRTLVANFAAITYTISTSSSPSAGGSTGGGGTYDYGQSATVTATPAAGYSFVNWTEGESQVSTSPNYTFTVSGNRTLVANFAAITYDISTSSNPPAGGSTSGGGTYADGQSATVTATPATGYSFVNWTEGGSQVATSASYTFTVSGNRTLVANFAANSYSISTSSSPSAGGSTSGGGTHNYGQSATVTATPATGYTFVNWTEGGSQVSTSANYTFTVSRNRTLVANFATVTYTINTSSNPPAGGSTSGSGTYTDGQSATVTATSATGYTFVDWTEGGSPVSSSASYTFAVTGNRTLVANFAAITYTISSSSDPPAGGSTSGSGTYADGQSATLTATPAAGYAFANWTEGGVSVSSSEIYTFTVSGNRTLVANFVLLTYTISTLSNPVEGGTTSGAGTHNEGHSVTVTATPNTGYSFANWTENGTQVSTSVSFTFTAGANRTLVANFALITYTINTSSNPPAGGVAAGGGTYSQGQTATVTATPASGYTFVNWTEGGVSVSSSTSYPFTVSGDRTLVANFASITYAVSTSSNPIEGGTTLGGGTYNQGQSVTVTATPAGRYAFVNWTEGGSAVSADASYTFTVSGNRTLVANFEVPMGVNETAPIVFGLSQNYPNPFNPESEIRFSVEKLGRATLRVYSMNGELVATLFDAEAEPGQYYRVRFGGLQFASGVYLYRLEADGHTIAKKMALLR
jgi:hypothetical protein